MRVSRPIADARRCAASSATKASSASYSVAASPSSTATSRPRLAADRRRSMTSRRSIVNNQVRSELSARNDSSAENALMKVSCTNSSTSSSTPSRTAKRARAPACRSTIAVAARSSPAIHWAMRAPSIDASSVCSAWIIRSALLDDGRTLALRRRRAIDRTSSGTAPVPVERTRLGVGRPERDGESGQAYPRHHRPPRLAARVPREHARLLDRHPTVRWRYDSPHICSTKGPCSRPTRGAARSSPGPKMIQVVRTCRPRGAWMDSVPMCRRPSARRSSPPEDPRAPPAAGGSYHWRRERPPAPSPIDAPRRPGRARP